MCCACIPEDLSLVRGNGEELELYLGVIGLASTPRKGFTINGNSRNEGKKTRVSPRFFLQVRLTVQKWPRSPVVKGGEVVPR